MKKRNLKKGFTLIEMLVAVSIFTIVAFVVTTSFISLVNAYRKAQAIRLVIDNLNFSMDSMSIRMREGRGFESSCTPVCQPADDEISFTDSREELHRYKLLTDEEGKNYLALCSGDPCNFARITAKSVDITNLSFQINATGQTSVTILLEGEATVRGTKSNFALQTTMSQRNY